MKAVAEPRLTSRFACPRSQCHQRLGHAGSARRGSDRGPLGKLLSLLWNPQRQARLGHACDYVEAMWLAQAGRLRCRERRPAQRARLRHAVRRGARQQDQVGGQGVEKQGFDEAGNCIVSVDPRYVRPTEVDALLGDPTKARAKLAWRRRTSFRELVAEIVGEDLKSTDRDELVEKHGFSAYDYHE